MKHLLTLLLSVFIFEAAIQAQAPQLLNYQGVARNGFGNALPNRQMTLRLSIRNGGSSGTVVYSETRTVTTNGGGLYSVQIGSTGTSATTGSLAMINWQVGTKFLQVEVDPDAGTNFVDLGTTQLVSVPYAMSAGVATPGGSAGGDLSGTYPNPSVANSAINTIKLADAAVTTLKLADQSVTTSKLSDYSVTTAKLADLSVTTGKLVDASVTAAKIADANVTTSKLADASVTDAKIVTVAGSKVTGNIAGSAANVTGTVAVANGGTGATTAAAARTNLGLGNVDNTSDLNKPISTATQAALDLKENAANKSTSTSLGTSDALFPTQNAVKSYVDASVAAATIPDATTSIKGKVKLAGDLTGTAELPEVASGAITTAKLADASVTDAKIVTVAGSKVTGNIAGNAANVTGTVAVANGGTGATSAAAARTNLGLGNVDNTSDLNKPISTATQAALDLKENAANKSTSTSLGTSDALFPTQNAVKSYVDASVAAATIPDATTSIKGKVKLAGDLTGTAELPEVASGAITTAKLADASVTDAKIVTVAGSKVTGNIGGSAANVTGTVAVANGGTGATTAAAARTNLGLGNVDNTSDLNKPISTATQAALDLKENAANKSTSTSLGTSDALFPTQNAVKSYVDASVAAATIPDATTSVKGKVKLAGDLTGTAELPEVASGAITTAKLADASVTDAKIVTVAGSKVTGNIAGSAANVTGTVAIANGGTGATTASAALTNLGAAPLASPTFTGTVTTEAINTGALSSSSVTAPTYASTPSTLTYSGSTISWNPTQGLNAEITLTQNSTLSFTAAPPVGSYGTVVLTQDATGGRTITLPTIQNVTNKVLGSTSTSTVALSTAANSKDILNFYYDGTYCYWNIGQGYGTAAAAATTNLSSGVSGTLAVANGGTGATTLTGYLKGTGTTAMTASATIPVADVTGAAPLASPTFTGTLTAPIYASTPQTLTDAATISWNPVNGLNASVTLGGNRTLSFSTTPAPGSYGALVVTQDGTGGRTLTLPSTANKVLGSTSTTTIALSTAAGAKDIINFYYDGTYCYWNVGQGYGTAATTSATNIAGGAAGSIPYQTAAGATSLLARGTDGQVLTLASGIPSWANAASSGVPYSGANQAVNLGAYDLTVNGLTIGKGKKDAGTAYQYNSAIGVNALGNFSGGTKNTALGHNALASVTSTDQNIAIGVNAMGSTTQYFQQSVALGNQALQYNQGSFNTALGANSLSSASLTSAATYLVGVGALALWNNTSGQNNTGIGSYALGSNTTGNNNSALGQGADVSSGNLSNATAIGYNSRVTASNTIQLGNTDVTNVKTSGTVTAGTVTFPNTHGTSGQVLTTTGSGTLTWATPAVVRLNSDEFTATAAQTTFTFTTASSNTGAVQTPTSKPFMYINGTRIKNSAYTWTSGTTVTYIPANNNNYVLVAGDRIQFDYAY